MQRMYPGAADVPMEPRNEEHMSIVVQNQERSCARQKLDWTDIERCMGCDDLGRLVWYSVANGGS